MIDYLKIMGIDHVDVPSYDFLRNLQKRHAEVFGWDTLDLVIGRKMGLEPEPIMRKFLIEKRGGLCFELNGAFCHLLRSLGFDVHFVLAHCLGFNERAVHYPVGTHPVGIVSMEEKKYLVDVAWAENTSRTPVPIQDGFRFSEVSGVYRLRADASHTHQDPCSAVDNIPLRPSQQEVPINADRFILEKFCLDEWWPQYCFSMCPYQLSDFSSTLQDFYWHPAYKSYRQFCCVKNTATGYRKLKGDEFIIQDNDSFSTKKIKPAEIPVFLKEEFRMAEQFVDHFADMALREGTDIVLT
ncbi:MAG: hypothetical protein C5B47_01190 [Verrucomicrobia bacterium]|nr:MAG: hypothetical protein C5B47_01190 [Verrucomicrobiota bacterium]